MPLSIATWNVNSVKARLPTVLRWLDDAKPDIVGFQEIKCQNDAFPRLEFEDRGYNLVVHGQKSYNGVALLSKLPIDEVRIGLPGDEDDGQARYIEAVLSHTKGAVRYATLYLPNGNPVQPDSAKYAYKLAWMDRLHSRMKECLALEEFTVFGGDYNVIPRAVDVHAPDDWWGDALYRQETLDAFRRLLALGYTDAYMQASAAPHHYTFWDYQGGAWPRNHGIRIDHLLLSPQATDRLQTLRIDRQIRDWSKPSDHVPVVGVFMV